MIEFVRGLLQREPARFVAYGAAAAVWAVTRLGVLAGVQVPDEVTLAVATIATFVLTEVIRRLVYSPASVAEIIDQTTPANAPAMEAGVLGGPPPAQPDQLPGGAKR